MEGARPVQQNKTKNYFIKDVSLDGVAGDIFKYADMSKILCKIMGTNTPPYTIAIIGKRGLGKSSLVYFVTDKYS